MHLYDLVDADEMLWLSDNRYIREVFHPTEPLGLLNYTDRAQVKPEIFRQVPSLNFCRGLIYNTTTGEVVARPFRKFWNHGQPGADVIDLDASVVVTDKVDGSLGILYRAPNSGNLLIATRGSFTSEQANHATGVLATKYADWTPNGDTETLLFEIIYPGNRIVVDNGDQDDLVLLGSVEIETGIIDTPAKAAFLHDWTGPRATSYQFPRFADVLAAEPRPNAEGYVVRAPHLDGEAMVKIKQEDYLRLHKIVFGLSERSIWEAMVEGHTLAELLEPLPDEFHPWATEAYNRLRDAASKRGRRLVEEFHDMMSYAFQSSMIGMDEDGWDVTREQRGPLARMIQETNDPWAMFALLDGREIATRIWKDLKPEAGLTPARTAHVQEA